VDVLSSRILLRPSALDRSRRFYRDLLGLAIYREFGPPEDPGLVFYLGQGLLEVSGHAPGPPGRSVMIWIQVRDVHAEHARLAAAGVPIVREPIAEPWGLIEMWIEDPDGIRIVLVEVPAGHPLRRDLRPVLPPGRQGHIGSIKLGDRQPEWFCAAHWRCVIVLTYTLGADSWSRSHLRRRLLGGCSGLAGDSSPRCSPACSADGNCASSCASRCRIRETPGGRTLFRP
jgi:catechol 2,3-dioxygenase-like lactoylglutathione lyase family enzyme